MSRGHFLLEILKKSIRKGGKHGGKVVRSERMKNAVLRLCPPISPTKDFTFFVLHPTPPYTYEECVHIKGGVLLYRPNLLH